MRIFTEEKPDWRIIIFFILLILLPFILFSDPAAAMPEPAPDIDADSIPGFTVNIASDTLHEDFPGVYSSLTIALTSIPTDTVTLTATPDGQLNIGGGPGLPVNLTFAPYPSALNLQEIKVKPVDDAVYEDWHYGHINFSIATTDTAYDDLILDEIPYLIEDNDLPPGINSVINTDTFFTEGLSGIDLMFSLNSVPTDTVTIFIDPDDQLRITGVPGEAVQLKFEPNTSCLSFDGVSIRAVDDDLFEGTHTGSVHFTISTGDTIYDDYTLSDITWTIYDNDSAPGIIKTITPPLDLTEGTGQIPIAIKLHSVPADTVHINIIPDGQLRITAAPGEAVQLVFPPNSSALNDHIVNIKAYDDAVLEGTHTGIISYTIETTDADYAAFSMANDTFTITDNEFPAGIIFIDTANISGTEGESFTFSVALNSIPSSFVSIYLDPDYQLDLGLGKDVSRVIKLKEDSALIAHTVTVTLYDDNWFEVDQIGIIHCSVSTTAAEYIDFLIPDIIISITDNDVLSVAENNINAFSVTPSLTSGIIHYSTASNQPGTIEIYDLNGRKISAFITANASGTIDLTGFQAGEYIVLMKSNGKVYYQRVMVQH